MGRAPCCNKIGLNRGRWTDEEDKILIKYIQDNGEGSWRSLPKNAGLLRCGKSCRLRWINYLRTDLKRGDITEEEEKTIVKLHASVGNRWSLIASYLPGRTDNEIKNYWNSHLSRKIYRFYKHGAEPKLPPSIIKRTAGRVSRSVAKKYNKSKTLHVTVQSTSTETAANDAPNHEKTMTVIRTTQVNVDERVINEREKENEAFETYNNYEDFEQHDLDELNYILESGVEDSCENLRLNDYTKSAFTIVDEMRVNDNSTTVIMENASGDGRSSGYNSNYGEVGNDMNWWFNEDEYNIGREAGSVEGETVPWDQEDKDLLLWLWDTTSNIR